MLRSFALSSQNFLIGKIRRQTKEILSYKNYWLIGQSTENETTAALKCFLRGGAPLQLEVFD